MYLLFSEQTNNNKIHVLITESYLAAISLGYFETIKKKRRELRHVVIT